MVLSAICSCGEVVHVEGADVAALDRLVIAVHAARLGVLSGEISAVEGLEEIETALHIVLMGVDHHDHDGRVSSFSAVQAPAGMWSLAV